MSIIINQKSSSRGPSTAPGNSSDWLRRLLEKAGLEKKAAGSSPVSGGAPGSGVPVGRIKIGTVQTLQTAAPAAATPRKAGTTYNGTYKQSGSFTIGRDLEVRWRQAPPIKGQKYPSRAQAISYEIYKGGKLLKGWRLTGPAYLDSNGKVHLPVRSPAGFPKIFKSTQSFYSENFKVLVKALNQFRAEYKHIQKHGWKKASFALRDKKGKIVGTKSTLLMGALIIKIGPKVIANCKKKGASPSPFAVRIYDNILRMLNNKYMSGFAHRMVEATGLKVSHHPTRGRSLVDPAESSAAGEARQQYTTLQELAGNAPPSPWMTQLVNFMAHAPTGAVTDAQRSRALALARGAIDQPSERRRYATDIANYLLSQNIVFNRPATVYQAENFRSTIFGLLNHAYDLRNQNITRAEYDTYIDQVRNFLPRLAGMTMNPDDLFRVLNNLPAFQLTGDRFRIAVNVELNRIQENFAFADDLRTDSLLPVEILRAILLMAMLLSPLGL